MRDNWTVSAFRSLAASRRALLLDILGRQPTRDGPMDGRSSMCIKGQAPATAEQRKYVDVQILLLQVPRLLGPCFQQPLLHEDERALGSMADKVLLLVPWCNHVERIEAYASRGGLPRTSDPLCSSAPPA